MGTFKFKKFNINQDQCAQKIGTDAVLLGAWCSSIPALNKMLDIGTGTGVIALMLAQRYPTAQIHAIEIDPDAARQAGRNFSDSSWNDRLQIHHGDFNHYAPGIKYDLITSNPPYFPATTLKKDTLAVRRSMARFDHGLDLKSLISGAVTMLSPLGTLATILPIDREQEWLAIASVHDLEPARLCYVKGNPDSNVKRFMCELRFRESIKPTSTLQRENLVIENGRHNYTQDYKRLTGDFYLNF